MKKHLTTYLSFFLIFAIALTFVILSLLPHSSEFSLEVFAKRVSFSVPSDKQGNEEVPLLYSPVWTNSVIFEDFRKVELTVETIVAIQSDFQNPLTITSDSQESIIKFESMAGDFSVQRVVCYPGSKVLLNRKEDWLNIEVEESAYEPYAEISGSEFLNITVNLKCKVVDAGGSDLTRLFQEPVKLNLQINPVIIGGTGLLTRIEKSSKDSMEETTFVLKYYVENLNFREQKSKFKTSTISAIKVNGKEYSTDNPGGFDIETKPDEFTIFNLSTYENGFYLKAVNSLERMVIKRPGESGEDLVPNKLSTITNNQTLSQIITWLGWILTIFIPIISLIIPIMIRKRKNEK